MSQSLQEPLVSAREKLFWAGLLIAVSAFGFFYVDARNAALTASTLHLETRWDAFVPFIPQFVFAYVLYFPWLLIPVRIVRTRDAFFRALCAFAVMQLFAQIIFVMFPSHITRPQVLGSGLSETLVRFLYRVDVGWNLIPSLHVGHSVLVALLCRKYARSWSWVVWAGTLLICASTVLIKQHYVIDVFAGAMLAVACYAAVQYRADSLFDRAETRICRAIIRQSNELSGDRKR